MSAPVILITGGSRGVGAATARLAAERGYDVAISFVSDEAAALAEIPFKTDLFDIGMLVMGLALKQQQAGQ